MIILDASGSMNADDAPGPRIDAAQQAVVALVQNLPDGSPVGVLVYGTSTGSGDAERDAGCRDVRQLVPVGPVDKPAVIAAVQDVAARGYTPMGAALQAAANELPQVGPASIVLVSDGIDTCAPPSTCEVASTLEVGNADLTIHTVGFKEDAAARAELSCVAEATGGTYRSAADGPGLTAVLQSQVDAALRPYLVVGRPVTGTPEPAHAPMIAAGQYRDTLLTDASATRHYRVELARGQTIYVAGTVVPAALRGGGTDATLEVVAQLEDEQGNLCLATQREGESLLAGKVDPVTALIAGVVGGPKWSKRCPDEGTFVVALQRANASSVATDVELLVQVEQPVTVPGDPVTDIPAGLPPPAPEAGSPVIGGASFTTAPGLADGSWTDSLSTGETRYYKVHLDWGQRFTYRVDVGPVGGLGHVRTAVATPLRQELALAANGNAARDLGGDEAVSLTGSTLVPVRYGNRDSDRSDVRPYSRAGDHYLSVGLSYPVDALPFRTTIRISIQRQGMVEPGPDDALPPAVSSPSLTWLTATDSADPAPSGRPAADPTPDMAAPAGAADGQWWAAWIIAIVTGATFAIVGVALLRIVRRRSRSVH